MQPHVRLTLLAVMTGTFLVSMDQTIVATITPVIVRDLGRADLYAWVASAYILTNSVALPIGGRLAEIVSPRRAFQAAQVIFLVGSLLCGLSPSMPVLVGMRAIQGIGGGMMVAVGSAIIGYLFPPRERGRYFGLFGAVIGVSSLLGPLLGGFLADTFTWRAAFFVNVVPGIVAVGLVALKMPDEGAVSNARFDGRGAAALVLWTVPLLLACSWGGSVLPWTSAPMLGLLALIALGLVTFYRVERSNAEPLLDLGLLHNRVFVSAGLAMWCVAGAFTGTVLFLPLYLVQVRGMSATYAGLCMLPASLAGIVAAIMVGRLLQRFGRYKTFLVVGTLVCAGLLILAWRAFSVDVPILAVLGVLALLGFVFGMVLPVYPIAVQNAVARERLGSSTGLVQFAREIGSTMSTALMGSVLVAGMLFYFNAWLPPDLAVADVRDQHVLRHRIVALTTATVDQLEQEPLVPPTLKARLKSLGKTPSTTAEVEALRTHLADELQDTFNRTVAASMTHVYGVAALFAVLGLFFSALIPDLPLQGPAKQESALEGRHAEKAASASTPP